MNKFTVLIFLSFLLFIEGTSIRHVQPFAALNKQDTLIIAHHLERSMGWRCRDTLTKSEIKTIANIKFLDANVKEKEKGGLTPDYTIEIKHKGGIYGIRVWGRDKWYIVDIDSSGYCKVHAALIKQKDLNKFFPPTNCREESSPFAPVTID